MGWEHVAESVHLMVAWIERGQDTAPKDNTSRVLLTPSVPHLLKFPEPKMVPPTRHNGFKT